MREVARQLHIGTRHAYNLAASGAIPSVRIQGRIRIPRVAWERWCREQVDKALERCNKQADGNGHAA